MQIVWIAAFLVSPAVLISAIYRVIAIRISNSGNATFPFVPITRSATAVFTGEGLLIAGTVIDGIVSIFVAACYLSMGALPQAPKEDDKGHKA